LLDDGILLRFESVNGLRVQRGHARTPGTEMGRDSVMMADYLLNAESRRWPKAHGIRPPSTRRAALESASWRGGS
jgi:hypothetical protein